MDDAYHRAPSWCASLFTEPLLDLGAHEAPAFAGVLSPSSEVGAKRMGVNSVFLENAEDYYRRYQGFDYWRKLLGEALQRAEALSPATRDPTCIIEYGCGFGNATLPMLDLAPQAKVIASDISPNLLAILERLLVARNLQERCVAVAMDAQKPYIQQGVADLVFGAAILHHLVEPADFIASALRVLKPGGAAFFFEPLEGGLSILLAIWTEIIAEAERRGHWDHGIYVTKRFAEELHPQIFRDDHPNWVERDDKWAFSRSQLDDIAMRAGAKVTVYGLHDTERPFRRHLSYMLKTYGEMPDPEQYPDFAWEIVDRWDTKTFSKSMLHDLPLEGCIIFSKDR